MRGNGISKVVAKGLANSNYQLPWPLGKIDQTWEKWHNVDQVNLIPVYPPAWLKVPQKNIPQFFFNPEVVQLCPSFQAWLQV